MCLAIFNTMKIWYHKSKELCSFYYHPFTWNKLLSMFDCDEICLVEHFSGVGHDEQTLYKSWFGCSPEFISMREPMKVIELRKLVKTFVKWPHEFKLAIENVKVERAITGGIIFTTRDKILKQLIEKLNVSHSLLEVTFENKLVLMKSSGKKKIEGVFANSEDLLDHIYNELMKKESPDYFIFIDALDAAHMK